jgi:MYXO-CTERM domain-containing protein
MPTVAEAQAGLSVGMDIEIVGYGVNDNETNAGGIKYDAVTKLAGLDSQQLAIGNPGDPQDCHGDSGGPAFAAIGPGGALRLVGVVSGGPDPCVSGGQDTRVDAYLGWVNDTIATLGSELTDAGPIEPDAGAAPADDGSGGGCGCSVGGRSAGAGGATLGVLFGVALLAGRRRRRA